MQTICAFILYKVLGWRLIGRVPQEAKYIFAAIPHTSNWDFLYGWLAVNALGLKVTIFAKDAYYVWPLRPFCKLLGVAPVNRTERSNFVETIAEKFNSSERLAVLIAPEGTRSYREKMKSGYFYLAKMANVPIMLAGPDYKNRTFTIMPPRPAMATFEEDEHDLIEFSKSMVGRIPENTIN